MMTADQFERQKNYCAIMMVAKKLLKLEAISKEHFNKIHLHFVRKYRPVIELF